MRYLKRKWGPYLDVVQAKGTTRLVVRIVAVEQPYTPASSWLTALTPHPKGACHGINSEGLRW